MELVGALSLGSLVTETFAGSVSRPEAFVGFPGQSWVSTWTALHGLEHRGTIITSRFIFINRCRSPEIFMYGMMCSLFAAAIWVTWASYMGIGVSSTHSIRESKIWP